MSNTDASPLAPPVSDELSSLVSQLLHLADPFNKKLCTIDQISRRKEELRVFEKTFHNARFEIAAAIPRMSDTQRHIYDTTIKALEGVRYGSAARFALAESGYFATVAKGMNEKLK